MAKKRTSSCAYIAVGERETSELDTIISAELPDEEIDTVLLEVHKVVKTQRLHGTCCSIQFY